MGALEPGEPLRMRKVRAFRSGWATCVRNGNHFWTRDGLGPARPSCDDTLLAWAGDLYEPHALDARCERCTTIERESAVEAAQAAMDRPCVSPRRLADWNRRIDRLRAYVTRKQMRDPIDFARIRKAEELRSIATGFAQGETSGKIRRRQHAPETELRQLPLTAASPTDV